MHIKESVKEFVHDVKRKFSQKRRRDSCSTCAIDSFDAASTSSGDSYSHFDRRESTVTLSSSSSSLSSLPSTPERSRFATLIRSRSISTSSSQKSNRNVLHKPKKSEGKRSRLFSSLSRSSRTRPSVEGSIVDDPRMIRPVPREHPDVIDISAESMRTDPERGGDQSSSQSSSVRDSLFQPQSSPSSQTDTLDISTISVSNRKQSNSESDTNSDSADMSTIPSPTHPVAMSLPDIPSSSPLPLTPIYLPRLTASTMFLPIPNVRSLSHPLLWWLAPGCSKRTPSSLPLSRSGGIRVDPSPPQTDPLSAHLTKYVPAEQRPRRDIVGEYAGRDVHEMVMSNSWRALAKLARDRIVASDPEDLSRILDLWSLRLSSLARLRLTNQASAECTNLFAVLNAVPPPSVPGSFPGSSSVTPSTPLHSSPAPATSPLSLSGLSGLAQLPGTPSQKPSVLPSVTASRHGINDPHPFELTVFHARVHYWSGDSLGYVDVLSRILGRCRERVKEEARIVKQRRELRNAIRARGDGDVRDACLTDSERANKNDGGAVTEEGAENTEIRDEEGRTENPIQDEEEGLDDVLAGAKANLSMWKERVARVCLILASQMVEMNDYQAAINLLAPLCTNRVSPTLAPTPSPALHSALARVYLLCGNLEKAEKHFSIAASAAESSINGTDYIVTNAALLAAASGDWTRAEEMFGELVSRDAGNFTAINNLAVVLLYQGRIKEGIHLLEGALSASPSSVVVAEPFLFNLSTLYELRSAAAIDKKRTLLVEVAKWSGDGLRTSCLKMPTN